MTKTVAIAGLNPIGLALARALDSGMEGLHLVAVSSRDPVAARANLAGFKHTPRIVEIPETSEADIVVEAGPAAMFERVALPALEAGRILVASSAGALLPRLHLVKLARRSGARIVVPTLDLLGLDAVRAAAEGPIESVVLEIRRPLSGLIGTQASPGPDLSALNTTEPTLVFEGNALDTVSTFPEFGNTAAALALAGVGPVRTQVRIWADPAIAHDTHTITVETQEANFSMTIEMQRIARGSGTGTAAARSLMACLRGLVSSLKVGS